jgi:hypothetical protein
MTKQNASPPFPCFCRPSKPIPQDQFDAWPVLIAIAAFIALWRYKQSVVRVVIAAGSLGLILFWLHHA